MSEHDDQRDAIAEGAYRAVRDYLSPLRLDHFAQSVIDAVRAGVREAMENAVEDAMPTGRDILDAVAKGVSDAFPYPSLIQDEIYSGTVEALGKDRR